MLIGNLIKSRNFRFLVIKCMMKFAPFFGFLIFEVRRLATLVDPYPSEVEQHHSKFVLPPLLKMQSKYAAACNQKQKREV